MPLTWAPSTPVPPDQPAPERTERMQIFEPSDFGDLGERTLVMTGAYELRPRFTGRTAAFGRLAELTDRAFDAAELCFAVVIGEPGMGKSRILSEICARARAADAQALVLAGVADENAPTYGPITRALAARFGLSPGEDPAVGRKKLRLGWRQKIALNKLYLVFHIKFLCIPFGNLQGLS